MIRILCLLKSTTMIFLLWGISSVTLATNVISQSTTAGIPDSSLDSQANDLSGIYVSAITSEHPYYFRSGHRMLVLTIAQNGNQIIATNESYKIRIEGELVGDTIKFYMYPNIVSASTGVLGSWKVNNDSISFRGSWDSSESRGDWNMTRL